MEIEKIMQVNSFSADWKQKSMIQKILLTFLGRFPLRFVIVVPFVILTFLSVGLTGYLSFRNGQAAINDMAGQLRREVVKNIFDHLKNFLSFPTIINKLNIDALALNHINLSDNFSLQEYFWKQLIIFESVTYINVGREDGTYFSVGRLPNGEHHLAFVDNETHTYTNYQADSMGKILRLESKTPNYFSVKRPWYKRAIEAKGPAWSPLYLYLAPHPGISIAAVQPIYNKSGNTLGVFSIDLSIADISNFLKTLNIGKTGKIFIIERDGLLITSSVAEEPFFIDTKRKEVSRLNVLNSNVSIIRSTALFLQKQYGENYQIETGQQTEAILEGKKQFIETAPFKDKYGLDWLIVVVIPESDFMDQIEANTNTTILLCVISFIFSIVIGIFISWWTVQPIFLLNKSSKAIAKGEWQNTIELNRRDELGELNESFTTMANQLKESFETLESKVIIRTNELNNALLTIKQDLQVAQKIQKSMLLFGREKIPGIDLYTKYIPMQEVGGDFYNVREISPGYIRIIIADATGHGVQSALVTMLIKSEYENLSVSMEEPAMLLTILNSLFYTKYAFLNMFFTAAIIDIDRKNEKLIFSFAGHPPQVLLSESKLIEFGKKGTLIGVKPGVKYERQELQLNRGDKLLFFTDGAFEEFNLDNEMFGEDKLYEIFSKHKDLPVNDIIENSLIAIRSFVGERNIDDDIVFVGIEII
jgi:phosphoserine phosphatase RsbU/P